MSHFLQDLDFSGDSLDIFLIVDFVFLKDLDGYFFTCEGVLA